MTDRLLVVFDRQHVGKPSRGPGTAMGEDRGALLRGTAADRSEADLTPIYYTRAAEVLSTAGAGVRIIDPLTDPPRLSYGARHERVKWWAREAGTQVVYLACHLNAGGGNYAVTGHDHRSSSGRAVARAIAARLGGLPAVARSRVEARTGSWARGAPCIQGVYDGPVHLRGVLLEPLFVDHREHVQYIEAGGLAEVGQAIADGLLDWWRAL